MKRRPPTELDLAAVDLNLLVVFDAVFRERHVGTAARSLHVTPSAASHSLGRLRQLFGDPLFLKAPKGVVPTLRASELAPAIADVLTRIRGVVGSVERFDPSRSRRRFRLGTPDSTVAMLLPSLLAVLEREAPGIDLSTRNILPMTGLEELDAGAIDVALLALEDLPPRFVSKLAFEDDFAIAARAGHPFFAEPTLDCYCELRHVVVSIRGDNHGYVDEELAKHGCRRRVALSVPDFMLALAALASSDLVCAVPTSLFATHGAQFGLASVRPPFQLRRFGQYLIARRAALADPGLNWCFGLLERLTEPLRRPPTAKTATTDARRGRHTPASSDRASPRVRRARSPSSRP